MSATIRKPINPNSNPKGYAKQITQEARALGVRGPAARDLIDAIDQAYFQAVRAHLDDDLEGCHEWIGVEVDALIRLQNLPAKR